MTRRMSLLRLALAIVAAFAVFTRSLQVALFAAAAGIRRLFVRTSVPSGVFGAAHRPAEPSAVQGGKGLISYHPGYDHYDRERVLNALREAAAVGATYLRCDVPWRDIMPAPGELNASALEWYASFLRAGRETFGFTPLVILSDPSRSVMALPTERMLALWKQYVAAVGVSLAGTCRHFQLLNEPNNPAFKVFPAAAIPTALSTAASVLRADLPGVRLSVNFLLDIWPWRDQLEALLAAAPGAIDTVAIDAYPETWAIGMDTGFETIQSLPGSLKPSLTGQALAVMETGYSTNIPALRDEAAQQRYFRQLRQSVDALRQLEFTGVYELTDADSTAKPDPEANFGLLDSRLRRKPAFEEARRFFAELNG